jgi:hypothetical protein
MEGEEAERGKLEGEAGRGNWKLEAERGKLEGEAGRGNWKLEAERGKLEAMIENLND